MNNKILKKYIKKNKYNRIREKINLKEMIKYSYNINMQKK